MPPSPSRSLPALAGLALAALALGAAPASGAARGETTLLGGLPLPAGALPGGDAGSTTSNVRALDVDGSGRYVVFVADADLLAPGGDLGVAQLYRKDRVSGAVELVSRANGAAGAPATEDARRPRVSADGTRVAWITAAPLDPADADDRDDVYVRDIAAGTTTLASPGTTLSVEREIDLSDDGRHVVFTTTDALIAGDQNGYPDVYRRDLQAAQTALVSQVRGGTRAGDRPSGEPAISADGSWVAYASASTDLTTGFVDHNGPGRDVWARSMTSGDQLLISQRAFAGNEGGNGVSRLPRIAVAAGPSLYVAYESTATDVAADGADTTNTASVYRRWLALSPSTLVSRADGVDGADARATVSIGDISADGTKVAFHGRATALGSGAANAAFVRDVAAGRTTRVSAEAPARGYDPALSGDGTLVAWNALGAATATSDPALSTIFARPVAGGALEHVSRPAGGELLLTPVVAQLDGISRSAASADGRYVLLPGSNALLPGFQFGEQQLYRLDTHSGAIELVGRADGPAGAGVSTRVELASISADGQRVAFVTREPLSPADANDGAPSLYVRDIPAGTTVLASRADGAGGASLEVEESARLASGGRSAVFVAEDAGGIRHAYVRDLATGATRQADLAGGAGGAPGNKDVITADVSADGARVVFDTRATNLDPLDTTDDDDVYVRDLTSATTTLVSRRPGLDGVKADDGGERPLISADGRVVAFWAFDDQVVPGTGAWPNEQLVARELASGVNRLVSRAAGDGAAANGKMGDAAISGDGSVVAFATEDGALVPGLAPSSAYVYARSFADGSLVAAPTFGRRGSAWTPALSDDGRCLVYPAQGHNAISGAAGDFMTVYGTALADGCFARELPQTPPSGGGGGGGRGGETRPGAPRLTGLSLLRRRFRVGAKATARVAAAKQPRKPKPVAAGTAFRFRLDRRATVTVALTRPATGRTVGKVCRKATHKLRRKRACTRWVAAGTLTRRDLAAGRRSLAFSGRVGRTALAPGRYRATLTARDGASRSKPATVSFTVVRAAPARRAARARRRR